MYTPMLKGLQDVHAYACERLENLVFDKDVEERHGSVAAYLFGRLE